MKILFVGRNCHVGGGCTFRYRASKGLLARGHEIHLAAQGGPMALKFVEIGVRFHRVLPTPLNRLQLALLLKRERFDIVHACNPTAGDDVLWAQRFADAPFVVSVHGVLHDHITGNECLRQARTVMAFDDSALERLKRIPFLQGREMPRVRRPVEPRDVAGAPDSARLVFVSRLSKSKGRGALAAIDAAQVLLSEFPELKLEIVGDGSLHTEVARKAQESNARNGREMVQMHGMLTDPLPVVNGGGGVIGTAYVALEALFHGIPVVAVGYDHYGVITEANFNEAVDCNFGDSLLERHEITPSLLEAGMREVLTHFATPEGREEMKRLRHNVERNHSLESVACCLEAIYERALDTKVVPA